MGSPDGSLKSVINCQSNEFVDVSVNVNEYVVIGIRK